MEPIELHIGRPDSRLDAPFFALLSRCVAEYPPQGIIDFDQPAVADLNGGTDGMRPMPIANVPEVVHSVAS